MICLFIVDAATDPILRELLPGDVINPAEFPTDNFSILAEVDGAIGEQSLVFSVDGNEVKTENIEPYALFGDDSGDYKGGTVFSEGAHTITATAYSSANGNGAALSTITLAFDVATVTVPTISISTPIAGDDIVNAQEAAAPLEISGTSTNVQDAQLVVCFLDGQQFTSTVTDGQWTVTVPPSVLADLDQGSHEITADVSDIEGVPAAQASATFIVDTIPPPAAEITGFGTDTGVVGDAITSDTTPTLQGTAEPGGTVEVFDGATSLGFAVVNAAGNWTFAAPPLSVGDHAFTALARDAAGNLGPASPAFDLTIEDAPSAISLFIVDAQTDDVVREIFSGELINPADFADDNFAILAEVDGAVGESSLVFYVDGVAVKTENLVPYAIFGDDSGDFDGGPVFADGPHTIAATAFSGASGSGSPLATVEIAVTVGEVLEPAVTFAKPIAFDDIVNALEAGNGLTIAGRTENVEEGQTVTVSFGGKTYTSDVSSGTWVVMVPSADLEALPDGIETVTADVSTAAGVPAAQAVTTVEIDTTGPPTPVIVSFEEDTGALGDGVTADATPTLRGTAEANTTVRIFDGTTLLGVAQSDGEWAFTTAELAEGDHTFTVIAVDVAGNQSAASAPLTLTIGGPVIAITTPISGDDLVNAEEAGSGLEISGVTTGVEDGQTVTLMIGGVTATAPVTSGLWSVSLSPAEVAGLAQGAQTITADVSSAAGVPAAQASAAIVIDTVAPGTTITQFTNDTGTIGDGITADSTPTLSGSTEASASVEIFDGSTSLGSVTADAAGNWSFTTPALSAGAHAFTAVATDAAGNTGAPSPVFDLTIEEPPSDIRLFLVDAGTDQVLRELLPGDLIDPADFPNNTFAILAEVAAGVGENSLVFYVDGNPVKTESIVPYAIFGDSSGNFKGGAVFPDGPHTISATAFSGSGGSGTPLATVSLDVTVGEALDPVISITTPIAGDDVINAAETGADLAISGGTVNVEDGQTVTVLLGAASYTTTVAANAWTVTIPATDVQALSEGGVAITASVSNAAGTPAPEATTTLDVDTIAPDAPVITGFTDDTGTLGDGVTSDTTPALSGTAEAGSTVEVFDGETALGTTTADTNGDWTFTTNPLTAGAHSFTATATDAAGNAGAASEALYLTIGETPTITITTPIAGDDILNALEAQSNLAISGATTNVEDGQQVTLVLGGVTYLALVGANAWTATVPLADLAALAEGSQPVTADVANVAGIPATQASASFDIDTIAPDAPVITGFTDDTGTLGDGVTSDTTPALSGTAEAGSTVEVFDGETALGTTTADTNGDWTFTTDPLTAGAHSFTATATDAAGNAGAASEALDLTIGETPTITITTPIAGDDILNAGEAESELIISGVTTNVEDGQDVTVVLGGATYTATVSGNAWAATVPIPDLAALAEGSQTLTADVANLAGIPATQASASFDVDTIAPDAPVITGFTDDTGPLGDGETTDTTPTLTGTAEAGSTIEVLDGSEVIGTTVADTNGAWSFTADPLALGLHTFSAFAVDAAGNAGLSSDDFAFTIVAEPVVTITITTPIADDDLLNAGEAESELIISGVTTNVEDGQDVTVVLGGVTYTATVSGNAWAATVPILDLAALAEGSQTLTADVANLAGTPAIQASASFDVDTVAPDAPVITGFTDDTGTLGDGVTSDTTPTLTGTAEAGSTIEVLAGSEVIGTTVADTNGEWTFTTADPLASGVYTFSALAVDAAGNAGLSSDDFVLTILTEPAISIATPIAGDDILNALETQSDLTIAGTTTNVEDGQIVTLVLAGLIYTAAVSGDAWAVTVPAADLAGLAEGDQAITADVTNLAGTPATQANASVAVDTVAPDGPVITGFTDDTGTIGDGQTEDTTPTLSGTSEAGATIEIFDFDPVLALNVSIGSTTADAGGNWSFTTSDLAEGVHRFTAVASDTAGNASPLSAPLAIDITDTNFTAKAAGTGIIGAHAVLVADVDGDGDNDIVTAARDEDRLVWLDNDGSQMFTERVLANDLDGAYELTVVDLDQDGDLDFVGVGFFGDSLIWYESDGAATPTFTSHAIALGTLDAAHAVEVADINGDGELDIVMAAQNDSAVYWFENDGSEVFTQNTVDTLLSDVRISDVGDFDGDGDIDIVSAVQGNSEIVWHENDGSGTFVSQSVGDVPTANSVVAVDIDGDGDLDVAAVGSGDNTVHWFENNSDGVIGADPAFTEHLVFNHVGPINIFSVAADDVDGDGDVDLIAAARSTGEVFWYEQQDDGSWSQHTLFDGAGNLIDVGSGDVDGDGDIDILAVDQTLDIVYWFDNDTIA